MRRVFLSVVSVAVLGVALQACSDEPAEEEKAGTVSVPSASSPPPTPDATSQPAPQPEPAPLIAIGSYDEVGQVSFYADRFHGRLTASGEPYDKTKFTAAHRSLPFGTWLRATRISSGKSVLVRVTDRGPFTPGRILDLSRAAAVEVEIADPVNPNGGDGHADMRVTLVKQADGAVVNPKLLESGEAHLEAPPSE